MNKWKPFGCVIGREEENPYTGELIDNVDHFGHPKATANNSCVIADHSLKKIVDKDYKDELLDKWVDSVYTKNEKQ